MNTTISEFAAWFLRRGAVQKASERMMSGTWWWLQIAFMFVFLVPCVRASDSREAPRAAAENQRVLT